MKKVLVLLIACVFFGIGNDSVEACGFCRLSPAQQRGVDQVANKFGGNIQDFRALYAIGLSRNYPVVLSAENNLLWTVGQKGWTTSVYRPSGPLSGKQAVARLNGELIALFYPDDKSFLFAVLDRPVPRQGQEAPTTTKFAGRQVKPKAGLASLAKQQEVVSRTITVPVREWRQEAPTAKFIERRPLDRQTTYERQPVSVKSEGLTIVFGGHTWNGKILKIPADIEEKN